MESVLELAQVGSHHLKANGIPRTSDFGVVINDLRANYEAYDRFTVAVYDDGHLLELSFNNDDFADMTGRIINLTHGYSKEVPSSRINSMAQYMLLIAKSSLEAI